MTKQSLLLQDFRAQKLSELRLQMFGLGSPYWVRALSIGWHRPMPDGLVLRTLCQSKDTCKGDIRLPGYHWPSPGQDHEYSLRIKAIYTQQLLLSQLTFSISFDL